MKFRFALQTIFGEVKKLLNGFYDMLNEFCSNGCTDRQLIATRKTEKAFGNSMRLLIEVLSLNQSRCLQNPPELNLQGNTIHDGTRKGF